MSNAITIRVDDQTFARLSELAAGLSNGSSGTTVTGLAKAAVIEFARRDSAEHPAFGEKTSADVFETPLLEELLERVATLQDAHDASQQRSHSERYHIARFILGSILQDDTERSQVKTALEEAIGPAPEA